MTGTNTNYYNNKIGLLINYELYLFMYLRNCMNFQRVLIIIHFNYQSATFLLLIPMILSSLRLLLKFHCEYFMMLTH